MELSQFVSESLVAIVKGVCGATEGLKESGAIINPTNVSWAGDNSRGLINNNAAGRRVELVSFDVAVVATETESNTAGAGVGIQVLGGKIEGVSKASKQHDTRIQFVVPLCLPAGEDAEMESKPQRTLSWFAQQAKKADSRQS